MGYTGQALRYYCGTDIGNRMCLSVIEFNKDFRCDYGTLERVSPMLRRIVAPNPGPFTFHGTGTFVVGSGEVAVVDPGPDHPGHVDALLAALEKEQVTHIFATHTHKDHSPGCRLLQQATGAPTYGYGPHGLGRILHDETVEEGADLDFVPDVRVCGGDVVRGNGWSIECVHTPGHTSNHVCYQLREEKALLCGDHVMAWSTSIISPPDGSLSVYLDSLAHLLARDDECYWPCHGPHISNPKPFVESYIEHRRERIRQVRSCLGQEVRYINDMVPVIYTGLPDHMRPAAARSVLSTLIYLIDAGEAVAETVGLDSAYDPAG